MSPEPVPAKFRVAYHALEIRLICGRVYVAMGLESVFLTSAAACLAIAATIGLINHVRHDERCLFRGLVSSN